MACYLLHGMPLTIFIIMESMRTEAIVIFSFVAVFAVCVGLYFSVKEKNKKDNTPNEE